MSELHNTTHWRRLREIIQKISRIENIADTITGYNTNKIVCYKSTGEEMQGSNFECFTKSGRSCWVSDNHYDIYEIPRIGKEFKLEGDFYVLVHNTDFDYWIFGKMIYQIDKAETKRRSKLIDSVKFRPYGRYEVLSTGSSISVMKKHGGKDCEFGYKNPSGFYDNIGARKRAYKTSSAKIISSLNGNQHNTKNIKGGDVVKIYKKKKTKK